MKNKFKNTAITTKITILYGGIFSLSILIISFIILANAIGIRENSAKREIEETGLNIEKYLLSGNELTEDILKDMLTNKFVEVVVINMDTFESYKSMFGEFPNFVERPDRMPNTLNRDEPPPQYDEYQQNQTYENYKRSDKTKIFNQERGNFQEFKEFSVQGHGDEKFTTMRLMVQTESSERYFIQTFKMIEDNNTFVMSFAVRLIILDIIGVFLSFLIGKYISRLILKPVENIRKTAERISIEDLSQRIEVIGPDDEMRELTVTFNSMIERLESSFKKQTQFISDASHELRTPISVIQGYASLLNRWGKSEPEVMQESIDSILAETNHMSTLIKKLLFLAKSDQNKSNVQKSIMKLDDVIKDVMRDISVIETNRNIEYQNNCSKEILADYDLIKQLIWIYIENSIKYTKENGNIIIKTYSDNKYCYISVEDDGAGISKDDIPHVFDRFYRADKSRNKEVPGTGLGLSIAQWIVSNHNGIVEVKSELGNGSKFITKLPSAN